MTPQDLALIIFCVAGVAATTIGLPLVAIALTRGLK